MSGVVLARALATEAFGTFVLVNALLWFSVGLQTALTVRPLVLEGAALDRAAFRRLFRTYLAIQATSLFVTAVLVAVVAWVLAPLREHAVVVALTAALMQAQELCRRVLYTRSRMRMALLNNFVNYDLQAAVLAIAALVSGLSLDAALWIIAATSLLAVALGAWQLRDLVGPLGDELGEVVRRCLSIGAWSAGSAALTALAYEAYPVLLQAFHGLTPTAGLGVIRQLLGPINLVLRPIESQYLPRAARALADQGEAGQRRVLWRAAAVSGPPYLIYLLALAFAPGPILELIYGERYLLFADVVRVFAAAELLGLPLAVLSVAASTRGLQRLLFVANVWNAVVILAIGVAVVGSFGLAGVAISSAAATGGRLAIVGLGLARVPAASGRARAHAAPSAATRGRGVSGELDH
ncbi:MAG: hypothetical protein M3336_07090 [Chloroflexota bacterium]|nr:hypothetical protein [Chloroflexota bacterium]